MYFAGPGKSFLLLSRQLAELLYFILPNLSAFDLKVNAIYALPLDYHSLALTPVMALFTRSLCWRLRLRSFLAASWGRLP